MRRQMVGLLPRLRRFARGLTGDPDKADDVVQAACERALKRLHQLREESRLDSWLYRIIYTRWIDHLRQNRSRSANLIVLADEKAAFGPNESEVGDLSWAMDVRKALGELSMEHRTAVMLVCVEGYSYAEAAAVLNVAPGTMASRVARARAQLSRYLASGEKRAVRALGTDKRK